MLSIRSFAFGLFAFATTSAPVHAQVFWKSLDFSGPPVTGLEPDFRPVMPGATPVETRAALVWHLRSALNIAALQCGFEPALRTAENYNAILNDQSEELGKSYASLAAYFKRTTKTPKAAQASLDSFGTKLISAYSTVRGQLGFCQTAGKVGRRALFAPKGGLGLVAAERLSEIRNSLKPASEQQFRPPYIPANFTPLPVFDDRCWKKDRYDTRCGVSYST
jgi:hypothetical protein